MWFAIFFEHFVYFLHYLRAAARPVLFHIQVSVVCLFFFFFPLIVSLLYLQCFNQPELYSVKFVKQRTYVFVVNNSIKLSGKNHVHYVFISVWILIKIVVLNSNLHPTLSPSDVFDQPQHVGHKKIEFHITTDIPAVLQINSEKEEKNGKSVHTSNVFDTEFMWFQCVGGCWSLGLGIIFFFCIGTFVYSIHQGLRTLTCVLSAFAVFPMLKHRALCFGIVKDPDDLKGLFLSDMICGFMVNCTLF